MPALVLAVFCALMLTGGQILWKIGLQQTGGFMVNGQGMLQNLVTIATTPLIIGGLAIYGLATLLWFNVLSRLPLSIAYPVMSLGYVIGVFASALIFKESVTMFRWSGVAFIVLGVAMVAKS